MENKDTAYLSNKDGFTTFSYGGYDFRFKTSDRLVKYLKVKEWDAPYGYIVVDCLHEKLGVVEDYIDLQRILTDKQNIANAINAKGVSCSVSESLDTYADKIT